MNGSSLTRRNSKRTKKPPGPACPGKGLRTQGNLAPPGNQRLYEQTRTRGAG